MALLTHLQYQIVRAYSTSFCKFHDLFYNRHNYAYSHDEDYNCKEKVQLEEQ